MYMPTIWTGHSLETTLGFGEDLVLIREPVTHLMDDSSYLCVPDSLRRGYFNYFRYCRYMQYQKSSMIQTNIRRAALVMFHPALGNKVTIVPFSRTTSPETYHDPRIVVIIDILD
jgi:hypothetical protein